METSRASRAGKSETQPWLYGLWIAKSIAQLTSGSRRNRLAEAKALNLKSFLIEIGHHTGTERHLGPAWHIGASAQAGET